MNPRGEQDFALEDVEAALSPNSGPRRNGAVPDMVLLHYTGMASAQEALARLRDPCAEVSAHYLIDEEGRIFGLVPERLRAWHAGVSCWDGRDDINSQSIGVEIAHPGPMRADTPDGAALTPPFPEAQYAALERLLRAVISRWKISPVRVLGHSDVAPGRKIDPGESFDWPRLAAAGVALDPSALDLDAPSAIGDPQERWAAFVIAAKRFGYGDWPRETVLDAARRRFHWWMGAESLTACVQQDPPPPNPRETAFFQALAAKWPGSADLT